MTNLEALVLALPKMMERNPGVPEGEWLRYLINYVRQG